MGEGREVNNYSSWNASEPMTDVHIGLIGAFLSLLTASMIDLVADCASPVALRTHLQLFWSSHVTFMGRPVEGTVSNAFNLSQVFLEATNHTKRNDKESACAD